MLLGQSLCTTRANCLTLLRRNIGSLEADEKCGIAPALPDI
ncbi:MAG: hypothetical protein ACRYG4_18105 [Janthinobacterium lividum]